MSMGEYGGLPGYPGAMSTLAHTSLGQVRWAATRLTAAALAFVGAVLALVGSFLPLYSGRLSFSSQAQEVTVTAWAATSETGTPTNAPASGYPLVFATIFLIVAAVLCWFAAGPGSSPSTQRLSGLLTSVGAAFLIGAVWTLILQVVSGVDQVITLSNLIPGLEAEATYRVGFWMLVVAGIVSMVGAVFALVPIRQPQWAPQQPMAMGAGIGMAPPMHLQAMQMPGMTPLPPTMGMPAPQAFQVDPLTGQPLVQGPYGTTTPQSPYSPPMGTPAPAVQSAPNGFPIAPTPLPPGPQPFQDATPSPYVMPAANGAPAPHPVPFQPTVPASEAPFQGTSPYPVPVQDVPVVYALPPEEPPPSPPPAQEAVLTPAPAPVEATPDTPPAPESPPGPAIPVVEDPLAEPRQP